MREMSRATAIRKYEVNVPVYGHQEGYEEDVPGCRTPRKPQRSIMAMSWATAARKSQRSMLTMYRATAARKSQRSMMAMSRTTAARKSQRSIMAMSRATAARKSQRRMMAMSRATEMRLRKIMRKQKARTQVCSDSRLLII
jgi:hypothetical protein